MEFSGLGIPAGISSCLTPPTVIVAASDSGISVVKTSPSVKIGTPPEYSFVYL